MKILACLLLAISLCGGTAVGLLWHRAFKGAHLAAAVETKTTQEIAEWQSVDQMNSYNELQKIQNDQIRIKNDQLRVDIDGLENRDASKHRSQLANDQRMLGADESYQQIIEDSRSLGLVRPEEQLAIDRKQAAHLSALVYSTHFSLYEKLSYVCGFLLLCSGFAFALTPWRKKAGVYRIPELPSQPVA